MTSLQLPLNKNPMMEGSPGSHYSRYQQLTRALNKNDQDFIREYIADQLNAAEFLATDLPSDLSGLIGWVTAKSQAAAANYRTYQEGRKNGERRKYFTNRAHALYFLQHVAPTKLVEAPSGRKAVSPRASTKNTPIRTPLNPGIVESIEFKQRGSFILHI